MLFRQTKLTSLINFPIKHNYEVHISKNDEGEYPLGFSALPLVIMRDANPNDGSHSGKGQFGEKYNHVYQWQQQER